MTCILHTARISNVNGIMCVPSWGLRIKKKNFFSFVPRSWQDKEHLSPFLYLAQNLPSLLFLFKNTIMFILMLWCLFLFCQFVCLFILPFFKLLYISRNKRNNIFIDMAENLTCSKETYGETKRLVWATSWPCIVDQV